MRKLSFVLLAVFITAVVSSCQPPKRDNGDSSPSQTLGNQSDQPVIQQADSSVEKAIEGKNLKDSVMNGKK